MTAKEALEIVAAARAKGERANLGGADLAALVEHPTRIAAWGTTAAKIGGGYQAATMLRKLGTSALCLKRSKDGHPWHPLYVPYTAEVTRLEPDRAGPPAPSPTPERGE